ncbi:MAG: hypothetical protein ACHQ4F_14715, partial [Candidatus Dormibacteria bacterium]
AWLVLLRTVLAIPASAIAGGAIIIFEAVEWSVIGFAWLQALYIGVGVVILAVAAWLQLTGFLSRAAREPAQA